MISLVLVQPDNSLLSMACDRSVEDVFLNELVEVDPGYFKAIDTTCDGDIGTLTEEIMFSNPVDYAKSRRLNITTVPKSVKKEFFFKEKIP